MVVRTCCREGNCHVSLSVMMLKFAPELAAFDSVLDRFMICGDCGPSVSVRIVECHLMVKYSSLTFGGYCFGKMSSNSPICL